MKSLTVFCEIFNQDLPDMRTLHLIGEALIKFAEFANANEQAAFIAGKIVCIPSAKNNQDVFINKVQNP